MSLLGGLNSPDMVQRGMPGPRPTVSEYKLTWNNYSVSVASFIRLISPQEVSLLVTPSSSRSSHSPFQLSGVPKYLLFNRFTLLYFYFYVISIVLCNIEYCLFWFFIMNTESENKLKHFELFIKELKLVHLGCFSRKKTI